MEENTLPNQEITNEIPKKTFFQKIAFILLDNKRKTEVAEEIIQDGNFGKVYRLQIILSAIICSLGLLTNSVPVIIGAMLIAPILAPIKIIAFSTATGNGNMYNKGLKISALSIVITIIIAWIITQITPVATITQEIYARTSPTMIDLFIALASGIVAFLSLGFKKLRENIAGVAMATALIPPLCVTGIGIHFLNIEITKGSFLLFLTNFVAIIFVGIIIFYAFGFYPTNKKGKKHSIESIFLTIITIILISTPLIRSMESIAENIKIQQTIEQTTQDFLSTINRKIDIEKLSHQLQSNDTLRVSATITVPNTTPITETHKSNLSQILALSTQKSVNLELNILNISSAIIEKTEINKDEKLKQDIQTYIQKQTGVTLIEAKIAYGPKPLVYINLFSETETIKEIIEIEIETISENILGTGANTLILRQQKNGNQTQEQQIALYQEIDTFIQKKIPKNIYIENLIIEKKINEEEFLLINLEIKSSISKKEIENILKNIQEQLEIKYTKTFKIQANIIPLSEIYIP